MSGATVLRPNCDRNVESQKTRQKSEPKNPRQREKEYLTDKEVEQLIAAAAQGRHGIRDACMIRTAWRHGLRVSELVGLKLVDVRIEERTIHIRRVKHSVSTDHPLIESEMRPLKAWLRYRKNLNGAESPYLFINERGDAFERRGFNCLLRACAQ